MIEKTFSLYIFVSDDNLLFTDTRYLLSNNILKLKNKFVIMDEKTFDKTGLLPNNISFVIGGVDFLQKRENVLTSNTGISKHKDINDVIYSVTNIDDERSLVSDYDNECVMIYDKGCDYMIDKCHKIYIYKIKTKLLSGEEIPDISCYDLKLLKNTSIKNKNGHDHSIIEMIKI